MRTVCGCFLEKQTQDGQNLGIFATLISRVPLQRDPALVFKECKYQRKLSEFLNNSFALFNSNVCYSQDIKILKQLNGLYLHAYHKL